MEVGDEEKWLCLLSSYLYAGCEELSENVLKNWVRANHAPCAGMHAFSQPLGMSHGHGGSMACAICPH